MDIASAEMTSTPPMDSGDPDLVHERDGQPLLRVGANVDFGEGNGSDSRIGSSFPVPGARLRRVLLPQGCEALVKLAGERGVAVDVLSAVESANERQKRGWSTRSECSGRRAQGSPNALWGLAFKRHLTTCARRISQLIDMLLDEGVRSAPRSGATEHARALVGNRIDYAETNYEALAGADALVVVLTGTIPHPDFWA